MPESRFTRPSRPPPSSFRKANPAAIPPSTTTPTSALKSKPLIYSICIAAIVACGAVAGAMIKLDRQEATAREKQQEYQQQLQQEGVSTTTSPAAPTEYDYRKAIDSLETRRGQLLMEKLQFERKISALKDGQAREREMEKIKALGKGGVASATASVPGEQVR